MSRKLVFASGLLRCFFCQLDPDAAEARAHLLATRPDTTRLLTYMERQLDQTPLELLARAAARPAIKRDTQRRLFESYDRFLGVLDDPGKREALDRMTEAEMAKSNVWSEIRDMSHDFNLGLMELFFGDDEELRGLTTEYGVF